MLARQFQQRHRPTVLGERTQSILIDPRCFRELCERGGAVDGHEAGYVELGDDAEAGGIVYLANSVACLQLTDLDTHRKSHEPQCLVRA